MKKYPESMRFTIALTALLAALFLVACGDDDDFTPVSRDRGYDYSFTSTKDFKDTPCNEQREGRDAAVGRDKDLYTCVFDRADSLYLWVSDKDTLTAEGSEFHRAESSSREDDEDVSSSSASFTVKSKEEFFNPDITYGTMTDPRDGKVYRTVEFNGQTWMAENLNFIDSVEYPLLKNHTRCYNDDEEKCDLLGRLYAQVAAMNDEQCDVDMPCDLGPGPIQGICPDGWHILSRTEAEALLALTNANSAEVMSANGWNNAKGTDIYGLSFVGSGRWNAVDNFDLIGTLATVWVYTPNKMISRDQFYLIINNGEREDMFFYNYCCYELNYSVRCIKGDGVVPSSSSSSSSMSSSSLSSSSVSSSSVPPSSSSRKKQDIEPLLKSAGEQFNPDIDYGTMTDPRDGKKYRTVEVEGVTWMAENLNYAGNEVGESFCYNDDDEFCELYGRLYSRDAAMNNESCAFGYSCYLNKDTVQGICPDGWHIPSHSETQMLVSLADEKASPLMSAKGWKIDSGTDTYGLSFVGAGTYDPREQFNDLGQYTYMWIYYQSTSMHYLLIRAKDNDAFINDFSSYEGNFSVRCVKD